MPVAERPANVTSQYQPLVWLHLVGCPRTARASDACPREKTSASVEGERSRVATRLKEPEPSSGNPCVVSGSVLRWRGPTNRLHSADKLLGGHFVRLVRTRGQEGPRHAHPGHDKS